MKKNIFLAKLCMVMLMLIGGSSFACAEGENPIKLSVTPLEFVVGQETTVSIAYETSIEKNGFNLDVVLPKGMSIVGTEGEDEDGDPTTVYFEKGDALLKGHVFMTNFKEGAQQFRVLVYHEKLKNMKTSGTLFSFKVKVTDELADDAKLLLTAVKFNLAEYFEQSFDVKKTTVPTGINGVEAEAQTTDAVYSIGGVRLNKAAKGVNVVIRNGKAIKVVK